jgi:hypothetical protein
MARAANVGVLVLKPPSRVLILFRASMSKRRNASGAICASRSCENMGAAVLLILRKAPGRLAE